MTKTRWCAALSFLLSLTVLAGCGDDSHVVIPVLPDTVRVSFQDGVVPTALYSGTRDAVIKNGPSNAFRNGNFGTVPYDSLGTTRLSTGFYEHRLIVMFDLSSIKNCSQVLSATLSLRLVTLPLGSMTLEAHKVTLPDATAWEEGTGGVAQGVSWTTVDGAAPWTVEGGDCDVAILDAKLVSPRDTVVSFSLSPALVKSWIAKKESNHGVIIKGTDVSRELFAYVFMREGIAAASRPRLDISYIKGP